MPCWWAYNMLWRGKTHPKKRCPVYDTQLHSVMRVQFLSFE